MPFHPKKQSLGLLLEQTHLLVWIPEGDVLLENEINKERKK
jgi:hypothetical protein